MTTPPELNNPLARALRQLATATKVISFYPTQHPTVVATMEKAVALLKESLIERERLTVTVSDTAFQVDGSPVAEGDRGLAAFATYLSRRDLSALIFSSPVESEPLKGFLEVIALDPATLRSRGGPKKALDERRLAGISVLEFDATAAFRSARTEGNDGPDGGARQPEVRWSDLLARYLAGRGPLPPGGRELMQRVCTDARAAWELMTSLKELITGAGPERAALLTSALKGIAAEAAASDPKALDSLAGNLASALMALDHASRKDILGSSMPIEGTDVDLATAIRVRIPEEKLGELVVSLVQSEGTLNVRLGSVIRKVLIDRGQSEQDRDCLQAALAEARQHEPPPKDVWDSVGQLLEESQDDWISREYKGLLEMLGEHAAPIDEALRQDLMGLPEFVDALTPEGLLRRTWLLFGDLVAIDVEPARQWVALDQIEKRCEHITPDWFAECPEVIGSVRGLLAVTPAPAPHVREAALRALQSVAARLVACYRRDFHKLRKEHHPALGKAFEELGEHSVPSLIDGLAQEEDWEIRRPFLGFIAARGKIAVPMLVRRLTDPSWYVVRNILLVLGEIADPATIPAIAPALKHAEPRVRRDAVAALGKIGGPRAFALLKDSLQDSEVFEVAMRGLATIDRRRTIGTFLEMTEQVNLFGRGHARLKEAITTLGTLGSNEAVPRLSGLLMRRLWIPPSAGDALRIACARALQKIGTATALEAVNRGARLWRPPVRMVCSEIMDGRESGAGSPSRS